MKLILIVSTQFGKFSPYFMLPLLYIGYCIEFIVFWKRVGGAGNARKTTAATELFWFCVATWFSGFKRLLCRDIVFHVVTVLLFLCRDNVTIEVSVSRPRRSRQEVMCCNFHVATGLVLVGDF